MGAIIVSGDRYTVDSLCQWDVNQVLEIRGLSLPSVPEIHFTNDTMDRAIVKQSTMDTAGVIRVTVPNSLLQKPYRITAYICIYEGDSFNTLCKIVIPVQARNKPNDYTLENDEEIYSFNALDNAVSNVLFTMESVRQEIDENKKYMNDKLVENERAIETVANEAKQEIENTANEAKQTIENAANEVENAADSIMETVREELDETKEEVNNQLANFNGVNDVTSHIRIASYANEMTINKAVDNGNMIVISAFITDFSELSIEVTGLTGIPVALQILNSNGVSTRHFGFNKSLESFTDYPSYTELQSFISGNNCIVIYYV